MLQANAEKDLAVAGLFTHTACTCERVHFQLKHTGWFSLWK